MRARPMARTLSDARVLYRRDTSGNSVELGPVERLRIIGQKRGLQSEIGKHYFQVAQASGDTMPGNTLTAHRPVHFGQCSPGRARWHENHRRECRDTGRGHVYQAGSRFRAEFRATGKPHIFADGSGRQVSRNPDRVRGGTGAPRYSGHGAGCRRRRRPWWRFAEAGNGDIDRFAK